MSFVLSANNEYNTFASSINVIPARITITQSTHVRLPKPNQLSQPLSAIFTDRVSVPVR